MDSVLVGSSAIWAQLARYLLVGFATTGIYFGCLFLAKTFFPSLGTIWTVSSCFLIAIVFNFVAHQRFSFAVKNEFWHQNIAKYSLASGVNYAFQVLIIYTAHDYLMWNFFVGATVASVFSVAAGYLTSRMWVFKAGTRTRDPLTLLEKSRKQ